jgi:two-component system OmpR family response regulator
LPEQRSRTWSAYRSIFTALPNVASDRLTKLRGASHAFLSFAANDAWVEDEAERVRVLVVDDEPSIVDAISMTLRYQGFRVEAAENGQDALVRARRWRPHVMVLDVMLPDMEGFDVARQLSAEHAAVPILFLSARDNTADKVRGLTTGGDDYVTKPFSLEELIARLRNILRRTGTLTEVPSRLTFADLELDEDTFEVSRSGRPISLTPTEFRLLRFMMRNPRRVLTRGQLLDHVWSYDFGGDARVLETYISYLRKKIDIDDPPLLHTIRGVGYTLRLPRS